MAKDLVLGTAMNYDWPQIKIWANSLVQSGFTGYKVVLGSNLTAEAIQQLDKLDFKIYNVTNSANFSPVVDRFFYYQQILNGELFRDVRWVIATDVKDVLFQSNPSLWLENEKEETELLVSTESVQYKNESWGRNNLKLSFGEAIYNKLQNNLIYNAGVLAGRKQAIMDLFLHIFLLCESKPRQIPGGGGPDQAALNVLLDSVPYHACTRFVGEWAGWATQLGTTGPQIDLTIHDAKPILIKDMVCTGVFEKPYVIVHQYDRVAAWKDILEKKYENFDHRG